MSNKLATNYGVIFIVAVVGDGASLIDITHSYGYHASAFSHRIFFAPYFSFTYPRKLILLYYSQTFNCLVVKLKDL